MNSAAYLDGYAACANLCRADMVDEARAAKGTHDHEDYDLGWQDALTDADEHRKHPMPWWDEYAAEMGVHALALRIVADRGCPKCDGTGYVAHEPTHCDDKPCAISCLCVEDLMNEIEKEIGR